MSTGTSGGSPSVRQHLSGSHGMKPDVDLAAKSLGALADYGVSKDIVVILENDSAVNEDPFLIVKIIETVRNPYLRALPAFFVGIGPRPEHVRTPDRSSVRV